MGGGVEEEKQVFEETVLMRWESSTSSSMESLSEEEEEEEESSSSSNSSSSEISDDATSSSSANSIHHGPLYQLSDLMTQLPIKRGLSKYYDGKSRTFASLDSVMSVEDLSKATPDDETRRRRRRRRRRNGKMIKSYAGGLDLEESTNSNSSHKSGVYSPKAIISKRPSFTRRNGLGHPSFRPSPSPSLDVLLESI